MKPCGHAEHVAGCHWCGLYATHPGYRRLWDGPKSSTNHPQVIHKPARKPLPCVHVGEAAGPKGWHMCNHEAEPLGMVVCACKGCGVRCPGYSPSVAPPSPAGS